jgi:transcriptional regulator with XRE-family HTH domain
VHLWRDGARHLAVAVAGAGAQGSCRRGHVGWKVGGRVDPGAKGARGTGLTRTVLYNALALPVLRKHGRLDRSWSAIHTIIGSLAGAGMPTIYDVARRSGVSPATVSRVLTGRRNVDPELSEKVRAAVAELRYRPNGVARNLRKSRRICGQSSSRTSRTRSSPHSSVGSKTWPRPRAITSYSATPTRIRRRKRRTRRPC